MKQIEGNIRRAIDKYKLIENGDKVAIGLSGGKDSIALLCCLANIKKHSNINFDLVAIVVDNGNPDNSFKKIEKFCKEQDVHLHIEHTNIYQVVFEIRKEKNPCSLCAKLRRGILCTTAKKLGANKLALGHHADDVIDTFFMSLIFEGRLSTFKPMAYMSRSDITVIRPLYLCFEADIAAATSTLPILKNTCPANGDTQRTKMKSLISDLEKKYKADRKLIFEAIVSKDRYNLF